ncbi:MAG: carboxymuconolactone decarboxylase family protein [Desulfosarcinaceae bacterium]|nr:carboxymuconolactone decarboxylase family protein [Desulfosarcinaceae bacterium]
METRDAKQDTVLGERTAVLIAMGAATALNCIPCVEHIYEKAITSGVTTTDMQRAAEIAGQVKNGAHRAISDSIEELIGSKPTDSASCLNPTAGACRC